MTDNLHRGGFAAQETKIPSEIGGKQNESTWPRSGWRYSALCYLLDVSNITHIQTKSASQCNNVSALCLQTDAQNAKKRLLPTSTAIICFFISLYHRIKSRRVDFLQLFLHLLFSVGCTVDLKRTYSCFSPPHLLTVSNRRRLVFLV